MIKKWEVTLPELSGDEPRRAYLYLPDMYDQEPNRRFPVLYMFDGHNVFFDSDATYGKSWQLASYLQWHHVPLIVAAVECNHTGKRRLDIVVYCDYETPVGDVVAALLESAQLPAVLQDPAPFAGARSYKEGTVEYVLQAWVETDQYWPTKYKVNENIQQVFKKKGLSLTCPHLNVHLDK